MIEVAFNILAGVGAANFAHGFLIGLRDKPFWVPVIPRATVRKW